MVAAPSFTVDRTDELPVGVQLAWKLRAEIASGGLEPGDRLPGVRELAERAGVNVNTARAVYGRLEAEGLIAVRQGSGTFVAEPPTPPSELNRAVEAALKAARRAGADPRDVARGIYAAGWSEGAAAGAGEGSGLLDVGRSADEAAARRELRRQIGRLEAQLASYPGARADAGPPRRGPAAHVAEMGELEAVRDALIDALKNARGTAERRGERQARSRRRREAKG